MKHFSRIISLNVAFRSDPSAAGVRVPQTSGQVSETQRGAGGPEEAAGGVAGRPGGRGGTAAAGGGGTRGGRQTEPG